MSDCMLSEERLNELCQIVRGCNGLTTAEISDELRRFFAPPPGSVRVEVAVCAAGREVGAYAVRRDDRNDAMATAHECVWGDTTHQCFATIYVPPTPSVEVIQ
jgi:hypothetical protein